MSRNAIIKPFLKWVGGKRQLISEIEKYLPQKYDKYYEVFIGGGALLFNLQPKKAVINDRNQELINCYRIVKDYPEELIEDLRTHCNEKDYFYQLRELDRQEEKYKNYSNIQRASRIIYLNKTCYNGLFRVNSKGEFNVPFGRYKKPNIVNESVIRAVSKYLNENEIEIRTGDFRKAFATVQKEDFIYLDPPYDPISNTASFTSYNLNGFDRKEQERLKKQVDLLHKKGCQILVSNSYTDFIDRLYDDDYYQKIRVSANRAINSQGKKRGKVDEILIKNY